MNITELKKQMVAVLGFGIEGRAVTKYLVKNSIIPVLFDQRPWKKWSNEDQEYIKSLNLNFIFGPDCFKELSGFNLAFRSPGIKILDEDIQASIKKGLRLTSQTKFFFDFCPSKIIGITGTKGKGTTASLIFQILDKKCNTYLTGNIGKEQPLDFLDKLKKSDWVIYELSSFQLEDLKKSPHIGVVLMITEEHQDYHKTKRAYIKAKESIVKYQIRKDYAVINTDFQNSRKIGLLSKGKKVYFSRNRKLNEGIFIENNNIVVKKLGNVNFKFPISKIQLIGLHNLENVCAAIAAGVSAGAGLEAVKKAVQNFKGLPHRLELVGEKDGVKFYDDSISTIPETAIAAINSFGETKILILGGSNKNSDFTELGKIINKSTTIKAVILTGSEAVKMKRKIKDFDGEILEGAKTMEEIFKQIKQIIKEGDTVLLSPACASFDTFKNYKDRGNQFKEQINKW